MYTEKGRKAHQGYEGKNKEDTSQTLRIYMDDEVLPGMNKVSGTISSALKHVLPVSSISRVSDGAKNFFIAKK